MKVHHIGDTARERRQKALEYLQEVGLDIQHMERYPHEFSGGQRQRVNIARALSMEPKIIVCDEPVSALDVSIQAQVINLFRRLQKQFNLTYVFISHDLGIIKYISDRIMIIPRARHGVLHLRRHLRRSEAPVHAGSALRDPAGKPV